MLPDKLAFVDIETTGLSPQRSRILEIGVLRVENNQVVDEFNTLINPHAYIDPFITRLTGISQEDVEDAPSFSDIKNRLAQILQGAVFVAHNARFDYGFIRLELKRHNIVFSSKQLCSVKLARALFPGLPRYNLDAIISNFDIPVNNRHRALSDALVVWKFYQKVLESIDTDKLQNVLNHLLHKSSIPPGLSQQVLDNLPDSPGVYTFHGDNNSLLYIGKSINIRERVLSHFSSDYTNPTDQKISRLIKDIKYQKTAGELGALFLESTMVKQQQPLLNVKLRHSRSLIVLTKTTNPQGYLTIAEKNVSEVDESEIENILGVYKSNKQLKDLLFQLAREHNLCHKLLSLEKTKGACFLHQLEVCHGACAGEEKAIKYNMRFLEAFAKSKVKSWPFIGPIIIREKNQDQEELFLIDKWCFLKSIKSQDELFENDNSDYIFDVDTYKILLNYLRSPRNLLNVTQVYDNFLAKNLGV